MQRVALLSLQVVVQPLVSDVRVPNLLEDDCAEPMRYWRGQTSFSQASGRKVRCSMTQAAVLIPPGVQVVVVISTGGFVPYRPLGVIYRQLQ